MLALKSVPIPVQDTAISYLNWDLLCKIFEFNAHMDQADLDWNVLLPGLLTLQCISQVCSSWREILLSSSSLWGRVINLVVLGQKKDEWGKEIIRRTGQAGLYVKSTNTWTRNASISVGDPEEFEARIDRFLLLLLRDHWTRIRSLELEAKYWDAPTLMLLQQPAPFLEVFKLFGYIGGTIGYTDDGYPIYQLFAGHAPSLRVFYVTDIPFSVEAPWMANLRGLHLTRGQPHGFTPFQILQAFARMPFLEEITGITAYTLTQVDAAVSLPKVALPRLSFLDVQLCGNLKATLALLDHITPSPRCSLQFTLGSVNGRQTYTEDDLSTLHAIFSRYSKSYLNANPIRRASIDIGPDFFLIEAAQFVFRLYDLANIPTFLQSFFSESNFRSFIASLDTVELEASAYVLQLILDLPDDFSKTALFPSLRILSLTGVGAYSSSVVSFLEWRRAVERSIESLDLTGWSDRTCRVDFSPLETFVGLQVVCSEGDQLKTYTCGGGRQGQLIFPAEHPICRPLTF